MLKEKLAFLVETETGIRYGGFVYSKIDKYKTNLENGYVEAVHDQQSFVFSFKNNNPMKYEMKEDMKEKSAFFLYEKDDNRLFVFGNCDIWIPKKGRKAVCSSLYETFYDHKNIEDALVGQSGWDHQKGRFDIKRIVVLQYV